MPDLGARLRRAQPLAVEPRQDHRDVVGSAALVGERDQPVARRLQVALARDDLRDLFPLHRAGEPVGAEHEDVAPADFLVGEIDLHARVGPERLEDDVPALALRRFLFRQLTRLDQALHQGLILGQLDDLALADEVGAAVTHLGEEKPVAQHAHGGRRRSHAAELGVRRGVRVDLAVRRFHGLAQPVREPLRGQLALAPPRVQQVLVDRIGRHLARHLARRRTAHAVGDHEQRAALPHLVGAHRGLERRVASRQVRDQKMILVVIARAAQVGLREDLDLDRLGRGASEHGQRGH